MCSLAGLRGRREYEAKNPNSQFTDVEENNPIIIFPNSSLRPSTEQEEEEEDEEEAWSWWIRFGKYFKPTPSVMAVKP